MELVENFLNVLEKQHKLIEQLSNNKTGSNQLANKNIVKSPNSTFNDEVNNSKLNSPEKSRVKEASSIFISKFFEEQKRQKKDKAEKTLVSKISKPVTKTISKETSGSVSKSDSGWLSKLLSGLGLASLAKLLKPGALKALISKGLSKLLGMFKGIVSFIWKGFKKLVGSIFNGLKKLFSSMLRGLKNFFSSVWKGLKNTMSKAWSGIKKGFSFVKSKLSGFFKSIGRSIKGLWQGIKSSKPFKALSGILKGAAAAIAAFFKGIRDKILSILSKVTQGVKNLIPGGVKVAAEKTKGALGKSKSFFGNMFSKAKDVVKSAASSVKNVASKGVSAVGNVGSKISASALNAAKGTVSYAASKVIKGAGGMFKMMGRLTAKGAARVPIIGPAIESVLATMDINAMKKKGLKEDELQRQAGRRVISGVTGMIGAAGGAALAGTLGSIIPGAGTAIGAILGAIGGDMAGRFLGGIISDYVIPKKYTRSIGAFVTGTNPPKDEMQDFIIKDGRLHKFNRRDEVLGMKTGGAIDQFLLGGGTQNKSMSVLVKTNILANQYLKAIAHNTALMVKGGNNSSGGSGPIIVSTPSQQKESKQMMTIPNNRDGYLTSPYALG